MTHRPCAILIAVWAAGAACDRGDPPVDAAERPVALIADAPDDPIVAEVGGAPVRASCVAEQAAARGVSADGALEACIDFELLAQEAARRDYAGDPEVLDARRRHAARTMIDEEFSADFAGPADVPDEHLEELWPRAKARFDHPEHRFTVYVRAPVPEDEGEGSDAERRARALAEEIHRALGNHTNLREERFVELSREIAGDRELERGGPFNFSREGRADEAFAEAAFAIPEVGMISEPTRTPWGWDLILLTRVEPETRKSFEEALPEFREMAFEPSRRRAFGEWMEAHLRAADAEIHPEGLEELATAGDPLGATR